MSTTPANKLGNAMYDTQFEQEAVSVKTGQRLLGKRLPIVTYHNVGPAKDSVNPLLTVSPHAFVEQVSWLARHRYSSINMSDWIAWLTERRPLPKRPILISFDDGYEDVAKYALPVLSRYGYTAIVYIVTGLIGGTNEWDQRSGWGELRLMTEEQISEWAAKGFEFGSHTRNHPDLRTLSQSELEAEILGSAVDLQTILGAPPTSFAYPYGHFNQRVRDCVAQTYKTSVTVLEAICSDEDDPSLMPRIWTRPQENLSRFARRVKSAKIESSWKPALRRVPGLRALRKRYLSIYEQYVFLSRLARERYGNREPLFDRYQQDYSHHRSREQERYQIIINQVSLLRQQWGDAIEIGCSKGLFTTRIASFCDSILACDISPRACALTAERCAPFKNVKVQHLDVQCDVITGQYDLVFVMDTLAYVHGRGRLVQVIDKLIDTVSTGGMLVFCDVSFPANIEKAWWQPWLPEGASQHVATISKHNNMRLVYHHFHASDDKHSYLPHIIAMFVKQCA